jgi:hypothetical protein
VLVGGAGLDGLRRVMQRHRVLNLMTHVEPWRPAS